MYEGIGAKKDKKEKYMDLEFIVKLSVDVTLIKAWIGNILKNSNYSGMVLLKLEIFLITWDFTTKSTKNTLSFTLRRIFLVIF